MFDLAYSCMATQTAEDLHSPLARDPAALVASLASDKALAARATGALGLVLGFDTVVLVDSRILGKPADVAEARAMLSSLSGRTHEVVTGVALLPPAQPEPETFSVTTPVRMRVLDSETIDSWIAKGEVLGCAGAYNIEHHLAEVDADQCYQNVAGLPLCHVFGPLHRICARFGAQLPATPVTPCDAARQTRCLLGPRLIGGA